MLETLLICYNLSELVFRKAGCSAIIHFPISLVIWIRCMYNILSSLEMKLWQYFFQKWMLQYFPSLILSRTLTLISPPMSLDGLFWRPWPVETGGSDVTWLWRLGHNMVSWSAQISWMLTLGTQLPCYEEAQISPHGETTWKNHVMGTSVDSLVKVLANSQH